MPEGAAGVLSTADLHLKGNLEVYLVIQIVGRRRQEERKKTLKGKYSSKYIIYKSITRKSPARRRRVDKCKDVKHNITCYAIFRKTFLFS